VENLKFVDRHDNMTVLDRSSFPETAEMTGKSSSSQSSNHFEEKMRAVIAGEASHKIQENNLELGEGSYEYYETTGCGLPSTTDCSQSILGDERKGACGGFSYEYVCHFTELDGPCLILR